MEINGLYCDVHLPAAAQRKLNETKKEEAQPLPPHTMTKTFNVDDYNTPEGWMHGSAKAGSHFMGVEEGKGLWLDFNKNFSNTHDIAIVVSIQGVNPLTGQKSSNLRLEQYREKCPVHDIEFESERYCPQCKYKWAPQNYLTTTATPCGLLWNDGIFTVEGIVRQYVFTKDMMKGFAKQIIGEDRVYAIGIAFYRSKEKKQVSPPYIPTQPLIWTNLQPLHKYYLDYSGDYTYNTYPCLGGGGTLYNPLKVNSVGLNAGTERLELTSGYISVDTAPLDIAPGAKIAQRVYEDSKDLSYYEENPAGFLYLNFTNMHHFKSIVENGPKDRSNDGEGFLKDLEKVI